MFQTNERITIDGSKYRLDRPLGQGTFGEVWLTQRCRDDSPVVLKRFFKSDSANPRLAAAVSAGLQEVEAKLADGRTVKAALAEPQGQAKGSILLVHEWWGLLDQVLARPLFRSFA